MQAILNAREISYQWFVVEDSKLRKYTTQKADADKKKFKRPDEDCLKPAPDCAGFEFVKIEGAEAEPCDHEGNPIGAQDGTEDQKEEVDEDQREREKLERMKQKAMELQASLDSDAGDLQIMPDEFVKILNPNSTNGLPLAQFGEGENYVYVCQIELSIKDIQKWNSSKHVFPIIAVTELDETDSNVAKKVLISMNPKKDEEISDHLSSVAQLLKENKMYKIRSSFEAILQAIQDVRLRLPNFYYINPNLISLDTQSMECFITLHPAMLERKVEPLTDFDFDSLRYLSPEEILKERRELTTPLWTIGCMLYEAHFKKSPFASHLPTKVSLEFIKSYPPVFPKSFSIKYRPELNELVEALLDKDPKARMGSDNLEAEVLEDVFFADDQD